MSVRWGGTQLQLQFHSHCPRRGGGPFQAAGSQSCPLVFAECLLLDA